MSTCLGTGSRKKEAGAQGLLEWHEVDEVYREPFILTGYRRSGTTVYECVKYVFTLHNDVGNFWTHFIPFVVWVSWLIGLGVTWVDFFQPYYYPLMCFWAGSCSYALFSSLAHMFSCKSFNVRTTCFILDYLGIATYAFGADMASFFYLNPISSPCYNYTAFIINMEVGVAVFSTLLCGLTRFYWRDYRFVIRILSYFLPYVCAVLPFFHRCWVCWNYGEDCVYHTWVWHLTSLLFCGLLTFFFVTKIPERFMPGKFDFFFQSHQLFHVCAIIVTTSQMKFFPIEAEYRKDSASTVKGALPSWETTFLPFLCVEVLGLAVVCVFGYLTYKGVLTTNKDHSKDS